MVGLEEFFEDYEEPVPISKPGIGCHSGTFYAGRIDWIPGITKGYLEWNPDIGDWIQVSEEYYENYNTENDLRLERRLDLGLEIEHA